MASHMPQLRGESGVGLGGHSRGGNRFRHSGFVQSRNARKPGCTHGFLAKSTGKPRRAATWLAWGGTHSQVLVVQYRFRGGQTFLAARGRGPGKAFTDDACKLRASGKDCAEG